MLYEKLDYVIAIAEEQNLTRAAKKLYISQPTLTMYLNRLEESLGVQLFDRRKSPVLLTPAGRHYIEKMREIAEAEQILRGELRTVSDQARTFRIGSARGRGHYWLPPLLRLLSERHPEIFFTVSLGAEKQLQKLLGKDSIDMAIGSLADIPESDIPLVYEDVALERTLLVVHRKYGLVPEEDREGNSPDSPYLINPANLQNLPFITPSSANGMYLNFRR
jgi:DNA-binding transcriptional LysR family regulator